MSAAVIPFVNYQLTGADVKRTFEENYLKTLFALHADIDQSYVIDFLHQAQLSGANPAQKQIYLTKYFSKKLGRKVGVVVFSYHFFLNQANLTGEMEGLEVSSEVEKVFDPIKKQWGEELVATAKVRRKGRGETTFKARWSEFYNPNSDQWAERPYGMLEKCSIANVLRWAFPESLSGMFIEDEISEHNYEGVFKVDDPNAISIATAKADKQEKVLKTAHEIPEVHTVAAAVEELLGRVNTTSMKEKTDLLKKLSIKNVGELYSKTLSDLNADREMLEMIVSKQHQDLASNAPAMSRDIVTTAKTVERYSFSVSGNTTSHKGELKALGGKWNAQDKTWDFSEIPADYYFKVKNLEGLVVKLAA